MAISEAEEIELGEAVFRDVEVGAALSEDSRALLISQVGERIAAVSGKPNYRWEFILIEDEEVNAFALPGGKVVFYSGILPYCEDEDGIAAVMAHEVAHVLARHGAERLSQARLLEFGGTAISAVLSGGSPAVRRTVLGAYGIGGKFGVLLPFSRRHEAEADEIGLVLMAKAGFDPRASLEFWNRLLGSANDRQSNEMLSTHPSSEERSRRLESLMPIALEYYRKALAESPKLRGETGKEPDVSPEDIIRRLQQSEPLD